MAKSPDSCHSQQYRVVDELLSSRKLSMVGKYFLSRYYMAKSNIFKINIVAVTGFCYGILYAQINRAM